ncbi:MAG: hypothetical protein R2882_09950 [Gemmatimonadales bacterium]
MSVGKLDLFAEMRAAAALLGVSPDVVLELATVSGGPLLRAPPRTPGGSPRDSMPI